MTQLRKTALTQSIPEKTHVEKTGSFLNEFLDTVVGHGRNLFLTGQDRTDDLDLIGRAKALLSGRGEASGIFLAKELLEKYGSASQTERFDFLCDLAHSLAPDLDQLTKVAARYVSDPSAQNAHAVFQASISKRRELFRRLNLAPGGTEKLVRMREDILKQSRDDVDLKMVEQDLLDVFSSWFNRGFLDVRAIDWTTPAHILEKIIKYEAVHEIHGWDDLRGRTEPVDRRCFAFFHPALADEPLIFVEVALTNGTADSVQALLDPSRDVSPPGTADTAVFYSISNCQEGLRGISFGSFLIKQVARELKKELPGIKNFATLSPVPGFSKWLFAQLGNPGHHLSGQVELLSQLQDPNWMQDQTCVEELRSPLINLQAQYLVNAKNNAGKPLDPVARFHLGNGARLERINWMADTSAKGYKQSFGLMVNYLYDLPSIERNHELFAENGKVVVSNAIRAELNSKKLKRK